MTLTNNGGGRYTVVVDGTIRGTVHRATSSPARHVIGVGGTTRWVATSPTGEVVSPRNVYTRAEAVHVLLTGEMW